MPGRRVHERLLPHSNTTGSDGEAKEAPQKRKGCRGGMECFLATVQRMNARIPNTRGVKDRLFRRPTNDKPSNPHAVGFTASTGHDMKKEKPECERGYGERCLLDIYRESLRCLLRFRSEVKLLDERELERTCFAVVPKQ